MLGTWATPYLAELMETLGVTANLALLDGDLVVYVAQVPSRHPMRMFTEVGRRVALHSTGVGKALLAQRPDKEVRSILKRTGMPASGCGTFLTTCWPLLWIYEPKPRSRDSNVTTSSTADRRIAAIRSSWASADSNGSPGFLGGL
jgi:Bacterial transcriptional regulator